MPQSNRDVQLKTFTAWINLRLEKRDMEVKELLKDLHNGIVLNNLLEVLSDKSLGKYKKKCFIKIQKIENLNNALNFLKKESIQTVNIGAPDIESGNPTCILGLIWTLILHYQISGGKADMIGWLRAAMPSGIEGSFTECFKNPTVMTSLVNHLEPGALPDAAGANPVKEIDTAMQYAKKNLEIPMLMSAEDMVLRPDEQALMLYVSYFKKASNDKFGPIAAPAKKGPVKKAPAPPDTSAADKAAAAKKAAADAAAKKLAAKKAAARKAAADKAAADKAAALKKAAADKAALKKARRLQMETEALKTATQTMSLTTETTRTTMVQRSRPTSRRGSLNVVQTEFPKGTRFAGSHAVGPGLQGVQMGDMEDYAIIMDCEQDAFITHSRRMVNEYNAMGLLAQKVYVDKNSKCLFTYLDWNMRNNCEFWLKNSAPKALTAAKAKVCFQGFVSNRTWELSVARHRNFANGIGARQLCVYKVADWNKFVAALRASIVELRSEALFSEELYYCPDAQTAIVLYEFRDKDSRAAWLASPKTAATKKTMGVTKVIRETQMDEKNKLLMGTEKGQFLVIPQDVNGKRPTEHPVVNTVIKNLDTGFMEEGKYEWRADGSCIVRYTRVTATYTIQTLINGHHVVGSPFTFRVTKVDPKKSRAEGPGLAGKCQRGKSHGVFFIYPRDCEGKPVRGHENNKTTDLVCTVMMAGSDGPIPVAIEWDAGNDAFRCAYPGPLDAGEYFIDAKLDNQDVSNCPVQFTVGKGSSWQARHSIMGEQKNRHCASAERSSAQGPGLDGTGTEFNIIACTGLGRPCRKTVARATIEGPNGMADVVVGENNGKGIFKASFAKFPCAGRYTVNVTLDDMVVMGAPFTYIIEEVLMSERKLAGEEIDLVERVLSVCREDGTREFRWSLINHSDEMWKITTDFDGSRNLGPLPAAAQDGGKVQVQCVAKPGVTVVYATLTQANMRDRFVTTEDLKWTSVVERAPQLDVTQCYAEGVGLTGLEGLGITPEGILPFTVHARDTKNRPTDSGEISVKMIGLMGEVNVQVTPAGKGKEGQYNCQYDNLTNVGYYSLQIRMDNRHIKNSPFEFLVKRMKQGVNDIDGANIHETIYQLGFEDDCVGFEWTVENREPDAWLLVYDFEGTENLGPLPEALVTKGRLEPGSSQLVHSVKQEDPDMRFYLRAKAHAHEIQELRPIASHAEGQGLAPNGAHLEETLSFTITPMDTKNRCMSRWIGPEDKGHAADELTCLVTLNGPPELLRDAKGRARKQPSIDHMDTKKQVDVVRHPEGTYTASYKQLTTVGVYHLEMKLNGEHIKDSPMEFIIYRRMVLERRLQVDLEIWERIYEVYNELGLISWDFEIENKTPDEYVVNHDFNHGSKNIGDLPNNIVVTECFPGTVTNVCNALQMDPTKDAVYEYGITYDERSTVDITKTTCDGPALSGNEGSGFAPAEPMESEGSSIPLYFKRKGMGEEIDEASLLPLDFEVRVVDVKGRPMAKFAEVRSSLTGPDGVEYEVAVGENVNGTIKCSYPALLVSGQYALNVSVNDLNLNGSPATFTVGKMPRQMKPLETNPPAKDGEGLYEVVYSLARADNLTSLQWELINKFKDDVFLVTHNFEGTVNMGELPEDKLFKTNVDPASTAVVCTLTQLDAAVECTPKWALVADENNPVDYEASFADGEGVTGNEGTGRSPKVAEAPKDGEPAKEEPLEFAVHVRNNQGRPMTKFVEVTAALEGPDGKGGKMQIPVTVGDNEAGDFECSYPMLKHAGTHKLTVEVNGVAIKQSPYCFLVSKIQDEHNQLWKKKEIYENVYQIGREDGLLSWQWEVTNETDTIWMASHDFTDSDNDNLGVFAKPDRKYLTEVPPGETVVVCTLFQQDPSKPAQHCAMCNAFEKPRYLAIQQQIAHMPAAKEAAVKALGDLEDGTGEWVLFVKHWDTDDMQMEGSPWANEKIPGDHKMLENCSEKDKKDHLFTKASLWLTPDHADPARNLRG